MNREILFKAKRIDNGEWIEGELFQSEDECRIATSFLASSNEEELIMVAARKVDLETVGQYIGKNDKNGKKIFEGDIAKLPAWITGHGEYAICKYTDSSNEVNPVVGFAFFDLGEKLVNSDEWDEFEIIGNTFENPELIGE